ncbi:MAG: ribonuclease J [Mycoplasma sp.]
MKNKKGSTYIFALGGLEEIGKNTYIIETDDEIFIFDAGIKFANHELLGMNGTVANYTYLKENEHKIKGLIITHGHEDHIGGIPHLLRLVNVPVIYSPLLPSKLIEKKLAEHRDIKAPTIEIYDDETVLKFETAEIDFCRVSHSIPDSFMLFVKTKNGNIASTGDFRFDFATNGDETNLKKLLEFARRGVDVLLCESTSSDVSGFSESDKYIIDNLRTMMINAPGRVFISTFASHLGRIEEVIVMAIKLGRKALILGKSMQENVKISRRIGYLKISESDIISPKEIDQYEDSEVLVILTGSQGEPTAALNTMARGEHTKITLKPNDTVILSSNPIPGNLANVENMTNNLTKKGVRVIENRPECRIHSSGHATRSEQQLMIKALDPKFIFPIHGEYKMLRSLQNNAIDAGFPKERVLITVNGHKLELTDHELSFSDIWVPAIPMFIDGKSVSSDSMNVIEERQVLSDNGIVHVSIYLNKELNKLINNTLITTRGCFFTKTSTNFLTKIAYTITSLTNDLLKEFSQDCYDEERLIDEINSTVKSLIWKFKKKNPYILVNVFKEQTELKKSWIEAYEKAQADKNKSEVKVENN